MAGYQNRLLLIKDRKDSDVFAGKTIGDELARIFSEDHIVDSGYIDEELTLAIFNNYCAVIFCAHDYLKETEKDNALVKPLVSYVANGGGVVFAGDLSMGAHRQLGVLMGGRPTHKVPDEGRVKLKIYSPDWLARIQGDIDHPIVAGASDFEIDDEAWFYEMDTFLAFDTLIRMENERYSPGTLAAWTRDYALGRVACLGVGHNVEAYKDPVFREIVRRTACWAAGDLKVERGKEQGL